MPFRLDFIVFAPCSSGFFYLNTQNSEPHLTWACHSCYAFLMTLPDFPVFGLFCFIIIS